MAMAGAFRAQAAMEYLVTYGWALLALFVVVAYLLSTGAFSANSFAAQECVFQPDLPCASYVLYRDAASGSTILKFSLTNGLGFPINVTRMNYSVVGIGVGSGKNIYAGSVPSQAVPSGSRMNFTQEFAGPFQPSARDFKTVQVALEYQNCRNTPCSGPYVTSGRISAIIEGK